MEVWKYQYGENTIEVQNYGASGCGLFVNGQPQDEKRGLSFTGSRLNGKLDNGEEIKVSLGGVFKMECSLFVNNKLLTPMK